MRVDPVRREEVRLTRFLGLAATPADAWRRVRSGTGRYRVEPIPELFVSLLTELAEQQTVIGQGNGRRAIDKPCLPRAFDETASWLIHDCEQCGRRFYIVSGWYRHAYCSDHCVEIAAKASMQRQIAKRAVERRQRRTGMVCAHCDTLFESRRSDRRFCSDICRIRAHRANPQAAQ